jgi:hypothetical protein
MDYRLYAILTVLEAEKIDFLQVKETSIDTIRTSNDGLITFIEFDCNDIAEFLNGLDIIKIVTYDELITILQYSEWASTNETL